MKFMMLMIPAVYHGNKKLDPSFTPDPKMVEKMTKYNEELGKVFKITDLNGLHPLATGARVRTPSIAIVGSFSSWSPVSVLVRKTHPLQFERWR